MESLKANSPLLTALQETGNGKYSRYDCYVPFDAERGYSIFVELKHRGNTTHYEDTMIEKVKYKALMELPGLAIYSVYSCGNLYVFNLSQLTKEGYDFNWEDKYCNKTTAFTGHAGNGKKVSKIVGGIDWSKATRVIEVSL